MDRTVINLISLVMGTAGVFAALVDYSVPDLLDSYWGRNPFALKAETIRRHNTVLFASLAVIAALLQVVAEALGDALPEHSLAACQYALMAFVLIVAVAGLVILLARVGRHYAKREWLPLVVESQREAYMSAREILRNDGWRDDQLVQKDALADPLLYTGVNLRSACETIRRIERLLEVQPDCDDLTRRLDALSGYFEPATAV